MKQVLGKAIVLGYDYTLRLTVTEALFPSNGVFVAQIRTDEDSGTILATISSDNSELVRVSDTVIDIYIPGTKSVNWVADRVVLDIVNTTPNPDKYLGVKLRFLVEKPVTRGL